MSKKHWNKRINDLEQEVIEWAHKWGYKGVSPECIKELKEIFKNKETEREK